MQAGKGSFLAGAKTRSVLGLALFALVLGVAYVFALRSNVPKALENDARPSAQTPAAAPDGAVGTVTLDDDDQQKGRIVSAEPKEMDYQEQVRAYGLILPLDRLTALYNNASAAAQQLKAAEIKLAASQTANARAHNLLKVYPSAASQAETAEAAEKIDAASVDAARDQIDGIRNTAIQDWGPVLGSAIAARSPLAENLVLRKSFLVQLTLQPGAVAEAPARIGVTFGSGDATEAELVSPATQTDPKLAGASYFYVAPAAPAALAGAAVTAWMPKGDARPSVAIPSSAVVWQDGRPWVYVKAAADRYERKPIDGDAVPSADGGYILPASRWPQGQSIVVEGAQALVSEESKSQKRSDEDND